MKKWIPVFLLLFHLFFLVPMAAFLVPKPQITNDSVAINRILKSLEENWPERSSSDYQNAVYHFSILNQQNEILFKSHSTASASITEAIQNNDLILDFKPNGKPVGKILFQTNTLEALNKSRGQLLLFAAFLAIFWSALLFLLFHWLDYRVLAPFRKLKKFALQVAQGNLDIPLEMDSKQIFGTFTESFDLMRDKLLAAKKAEALANQSKKELVASLSHDIKTPVTSIKLLCELMELQPPDTYPEKLHTIYTKAEQIDKLVTNLFQSAMEDLEELKVHTTEIESTLLLTFLENVDYYKTMTAAPCPSCILSADPLRLEQVIDNVVNNSHKYAKTAIHIDYQLVDEFLIVTIRDFGPGVELMELSHLTDKFFRGKYATQSNLGGGGLGLYISQHLMKRMNGELSCHNLEDGFCVTLLIPLA